MPQCEGCRRPLLDNAADRSPLWVDVPDGPAVYQCDSCKGLYGVFVGDRPDAAQLARMTPSAAAAMAVWFRALAGDAPLVEMFWQGQAADDATPPPIVKIASTALPDDRLSKAGRAMLARALPIEDARWPLWWHHAEPWTWTLWDETPATIAVSERRGPRVTMREVFTRATEYGAADDPAMFSGHPDRAAACSWWAAMLGPIHLARVALLRAGPDGAARVQLSARDRADLAAPANVADAGFADLLARRSAVSRGILAALGWPLPPE